MQWLRGVQQSICEATTHRSLRRIGCNRRRPHHISTTNRKKRYNLPTKTGQLKTGKML